MADRSSSALNSFLRQNGWHNAARTPLAQDASPRQYARLHHKGDSVILMQDKDAQARLRRKRVRAFRGVAQALQKTGLSAPQVLAADVRRGFMLLEDFGDQRLRLVTKKDDGKTKSKECFQKVTEGLAHLHRHFDSSHWSYEGWSLPRYRMKAYEREHMEFVHFHLRAWGMGYDDSLAQEFCELMAQLLTPIIAYQPQAPVLGDVHLDNLMWLPARTGVKGIGWLDFQDAALGHPAFDLVSLFDDVRQDIPQSIKQHCWRVYQKKMGVGDEFIRQGETLSLQRLFKIAGRFVKLERDDKKDMYRQHLKRTWQYIDDYLQKDQHRELRRWFGYHIPHYAHHAPPLVTVAALPQAMILAAGRGSRLAPLTNHIPKPLLPLRLKKPRSVLAQLVANLRKNNVHHIVINARHRSDVTKGMTRNWNIILSDESHHPHELHSGGGVAAALLHLRHEAFYLINGDSLWRDEGFFSLLAVLAHLYQPSMDGLLVLLPRHCTPMTKADFHLDADGRLRRVTHQASKDKEYVFGGIQILHARLFDGIKKNAAMKLNALYDDAIARRRLHGMVFDGGWCHLSGFDDLWRMHRFMRRI